MQNRCQETNKCSERRCLHRLILLRCFGDWSQSMNTSVFGKTDTAWCVFASCGIFAVDRRWCHCASQRSSSVDPIEIIRLNYYWHALCFDGNVAANPLIIMRDGVDTQGSFTEPSRK